MNNLTLLGFTESNFLMICEILLSTNKSPKLFIFDNQKKFDIEPELLNFKHQLIENISLSENFVFCLAKPNGKKFFVEDFNLDSSKFINLIHSKSEISIFSKYGNGLRIEPYSYVGPKTIIGDFVNINRGVYIGHHNKIGNYSTINPGVKTSGGVEIGNNTEIGIGSVIINDIKIGNNTIIGAGSIVTKNIPDNVLAFGNPCKVIRINQ